ncbi:MAG: 6-bladed beta-propeller, partial [Armatimonadota bacterium]
GGDEGGAGPERGTLILPNGGTITSADRNSTVEVPDAAIDEPQRFTVERVLDPPADPGLVADTAYRYGPEGWVFDAPVTITIGYREENIPEGVDEATLRIARLQGGAWEAVGTSAVDQQANTVSAQIDRFSVFAIVGRTAAAGGYVFDGAWGSRGSDDGEFRAMGGIAYRGGLVFVTDMVPYITERIQRFDANGVLLGDCQDWDDEDGATGGIDLDADGNTYTSVLDVFTKVAGGCGLVFNRDATDLGLIAFAPTDVALDGAGNIFIAEMDQHRITRLNAAGDLIGQIGEQGAGDGQFNSVGGIAVGTDGSIYASDHLGNRVLRFSNTGAFIGEFGETGDGNGQFRGPRGIDVDDDGNVYVADSAGNRVQKLDENGAFIATFGEEGDGDGEFDSPTDVAVTPNGNTVYVVDSLNYRVQKFVAQ